MPPKVLIMRGLPGAGKTTYAASIHGRTVWFSADDFFTTTYGVYNFDPKRIGEAHADCFRRFITELWRGGDNADLYIVDNTAISAWEIAPYIQAASAFGLTHEIITIVCPPEIAAVRNIHGVPVNVIWDMHRRLLTETLPPFWNHRVVLGE